MRRLTIIALLLTLAAVLPACGKIQELLGNAETTPAEAETPEGGEGDKMEEKAEETPEGDKMEEPEGDKMEEKAEGEGDKMEEKAEGEGDKMAPEGEGDKMEEKAEGEGDKMEAPEPDKMEEKADNAPTDQPTQKGDPTKLDDPEFKLKDPDLKAPELGGTKRRARLLGN